MFHQTVVALHLLIIGLFDIFALVLMCFVDAVVFIIIVRNAPDEITDLWAKRNHKASSTATANQNHCQTQSNELRKT